jgi:hypothetical protein
MKEALNSSETSALTRTTRRNISEDIILSPGSITSEVGWCRVFTVNRAYLPCRMASSGMLRRVALVKTEVSEELSASFIRVPRIGD